MNIADRTINALQGQSFAYHQGENAALLYTVNWAAVLGADTIVTSTWASEGAAATIANEADTDSTASARLSGQPGKYTVVNTITTAAGNTDQRVILLTVAENRGSVIGDYE